MCVGKNQKITLRRPRTSSAPPPSPSFKESHGLLALAYKVPLAGDRVKCNVR